MTLAQQLAAWALWRDGWCVKDIADKMGVLPVQARRALFGEGK